MDMEWAKDGLYGRALHRPGPARDRSIAKATRDVLETLSAEEKGKVLVAGAAWAKRSHRAGARDQERAQPPRVQRGRSAGDRQDRPRLGADHEESRGDRHQSRRPHLPCGDRQPRTRGSRPLSAPRRHRMLRDGQTVTVSCAEGDTGFVYEGKLAFEVDGRVSDLPAAHEIMMNVGNPEEAFRLSLIPNDGVGLARRSSSSATRSRSTRWRCSNSTARRSRK